MEDVTLDLSTDDVAETGHPVKSKKKIIFILPIILVLIIALLVILIRFDIGKISSKYIAPKIKDIPIVNKLLPKTEEISPYDGYSEKQLVDIINGSELQLKEAQEKVDDQFLQIVNLEKKIEDLQVFENEFLKFKEEKRLFDEELGNMDKEEFVKFYEKIYPENAKEIYLQIVQVQQMTKEQRKYAALISEMDETRAAKVLENLFQTDMDIILSILSNMETESASAILEEMDSKIASIVVKQLSPE